MPAHNAILPGWPALHRLYVDLDLSLAAIGARYGVGPDTVYMNLKRNAAKHGHAWPLKQGRADWREQLGRRISRTRWSTVPVDLIRDEILDCRAQHRVTTTDIAARMGVHRSTLYRITGGTVTKAVSRRTAERIMAALDSYDGRAATECTRRAAIARRRQTVGRLVHRGMTTRTIADRLGATHDAIERDRRTLREHAA